MSQRPPYRIHEVFRLQGTAKIWISRDGGAEIYIYKKIVEKHMTKKWLKQKEIELPKFIFNLMNSYPVL